MAVAERTLVDELLRLLPAERVLWRDYDLMLYEYDGSIDKVRPLVVVFPRSTEDVSRVVRLCNRFGLAYTARGAGTGLSGGALPVAGGVLISLARMNRIYGVAGRVEPVAGFADGGLGAAARADGVVIVRDGSEGHARDSEVWVYLFDA